MLAPTFLRNSEIIRFNGTPFFTGDGSTTSATLLDRHGNPISASKLKSVKAIHRTDWQGRQLLYATARTQLIFQTSILSHATWSKSLVNVSVSTDKVGVTGPYFYTVTRTGIGGSGLGQTGKPLPGVGNTSMLRVWIRAGTKNQIQIGILNNATGTAYPVTGRIVSGPGGVGSGGLPFVATFTGLSTTQDTCVEISRVQPATDTGTLACFIYPNSTSGASGDSVLVGAPNMFNGTMSGSYIEATDTAVTVTDYTLSGPSVSFGEAPRGESSPGAGDAAVCDWDGVAKR